MLRVRLRRSKKGDAAEVASWLAEAVAAIQGRNGVRHESLSLPELLRRWDERYPRGAVLVGELLRGPVVGLVRVRDGTPGLVVIDALTVRADLRNLGYGQEMVIALEQAKGAPGVRAAAGVPRSNGLAIYFWLRTGYRPLYPMDERRHEGLSPAMLWMVRDLARPSAPGNYAGVRGSLRGRGGAPAARSRARRRRQRMNQ